MSLSPEALEVVQLLLDFASFAVAVLHLLRAR